MTLHAKHPHEGIDVACPTCHAEPGQPCTSRTGLPTSLPHRTRFNAALAARSNP